MEKNPVEPKDGCKGEQKKRVEVQTSRNVQGKEGSRIFLSGWGCGDDSCFSPKKMFFSLAR